MTTYHPKRFHLILAPGQWKLFCGVKVENTTDKIIKIEIGVIDK